MRFFSASKLTVPTLKSPSVANKTRLMPSLINACSATAYASCMPAPPLVEPPALKRSKAAIILRL
ncbi:secreted protein [Candidatus Thiomargarita nelsonii]|uniref:Secreted protein n=1 Tax=Candidatus Thiomargarita nelsonii TaxID=1003181 RepID=A0A176S585_9GAMM|nr:secreted protein [Candidatus Thiomargarita nelsonii]